MDKVLIDGSFLFQTQGRDCNGELHDEANQKSDLNSQILVADYECSYGLARYQLFCSRAWLVKQWGIIDSRWLNGRILFKRESKMWWEWSRDLSQERVIWYLISMESNFWWFNICSIPERQSKTVIHLWIRAKSIAEASACTEDPASAYVRVRRRSIEVSISGNRFDGSALKFEAAAARGTAVQLTSLLSRCAALRELNRVATFRTRMLHWILTLAPSFLSSPLPPPPPPSFALSLSLSFSLCLSFSVSLSLSLSLSVSLNPPLTLPGDIKENYGIILCIFSVSVLRVLTYEAFVEILCKIPSHLKREKERRKEIDICSIFLSSPG